MFGLEDVVTFLDTVTELVDSGVRMILLRSNRGTTVKGVNYG